MSIRSRIIANNLAVILVLNTLCMAACFLIFWVAASPFAGEHIGENAAHIAARYFPFGAAVALALTLVGAICVVSVTARRVAGPLARLKRAAFEIREGNLGYELAVSGRDEFSELAAGFEQMRIRLKDTMRLQEKAEAERRMMMASITHDLKTPITSIIGYAEGILDGVAATPEKTNEYAAVICKKARSLQTLSDDLSLLSLLENAGLPLDKRADDLGALVSEVASEFWNTADTGGQPRCVSGVADGTQDDRCPSFRSSIEPGLRVMIDREKMARVLLNLFQNSEKYKKPGQPGPEISLTLARQGDQALLTVSDNGIGIAQSDLPHVFDQFYRADASRGIQSGSGLGLSIARHIVKLHGGKIWIINNPGGGIAVHIALPIIGGSDAENTDN